MKCPLALPTSGVVALGCALLMVISVAHAQTTTGAVNPRPASAEPSATGDPPPGGCTPIGLTASGEIVFPFQCKDFIERQRAANTKPAAVEMEKPAVADIQKPAAAENEKPAAAEAKPAAEEKPATAEAKPAAEENPATAEAKPAAVEAKPAAAEEKPAAGGEKTAAKQQDRVTPENSKPAAEPVVQIPLPKRAERAAGPPGCMHFRSYDPASGTYRAFDGLRRQCREVVGQSFRK